MPSTTTPPHHRRGRRAAPLLIAAIVVLGAGCQLRETNNYTISGGTSFYMTIHQESSAALTLLGEFCGWGHQCIRDQIHQRVTIEGTGAAQFNRAVDERTDQLADRMREVKINGGSVNVGGPCLQAWHSYFGTNAGWNFVPKDRDHCRHG